MEVPARSYRAKAVPKVLHILTQYREIELTTIPSPKWLTTLFDQFVPAALRRNPVKKLPATGPKSHCYGYHKSNETHLEVVEGVPACILSALL